MKVYLAGISGVRKQLLEDRVDLSQLFVLESYFSMQKWFVPLIHRFGSFLLDSGAFTFMSDAKKHGEVDWENYADQYADFTRENQIKLYFELDIDVIVGLPEVERLRQRIEKRVGWKSIPVWHVSRGKDKFLEIATDYPYIAFGGIITDGVSTKTLEKYMPWFINEAHKRRAKIHGLGYTNLKGLTKLRFDSVDSTTWTMGGRYGQVMQYKNGTIIKHDSVKSGVKVRSVKDTSEVTFHNFLEWVKFQRYAENNL